MDLKRPRKLNLNAPLLSTRRIGYSGSEDTSCSSNVHGVVKNTSERVPFSWEQAPGKPKDTESVTAGESKTWRKTADEQKGTSASADVLEDGYRESKTGSRTANGWTEQKGTSAEADVLEDGYKDDVYSDAMDVFSLSEALDIVQKKTEKNAHSENNEGLRLKLAESNGYQSPTYMINRFLPDATALAASSALHFPSDFDNRVCDTCSYPDCYLPGSTRHSYASSSSSKGCGLELLFPWRMKHKLCAMKSPVLPCSTNVQKKHQHSSKKKKNGSSTHLPWTCTNAKEDV